MERRHEHLHSEKFRIGVDVRRALEVLSGNVFSGRQACIRELIANAADSIAQLPPDKKSNVGIRIIPDLRKGMLSISDNGAGMTQADAKSVLGMVFATTKQARRDSIGQFGIGFYSCFPLCSKVEVLTRSLRRDDSGTRLAYVGGETLQIGPTNLPSHGTTVALHLLEEHKPLLSRDVLLELVQEDCDFIPYPLYLGDGCEVLNRLDAPWYHDSPHGVLREALKSIYQIEDTLALIPIHESDGSGTVCGVLYLGRSQRKPTMRVYSHRVLVTKTDESLLDDELRPFVSGVVDAEDLPLVLSRNAVLDGSPQVIRLRRLLLDRLGDGLAELARSRNPEFRRVMAEHGPAIKTACLEYQSLWTRLCDFIPYHSSLRHSATVSEYLSGRPGNTVIYADDRNVGESLIPLYNQANVEVLFMTDAIDRPLRDRWRWRGRKVHFKRVDVDPPADTESKDRSTLTPVQADVMESLRMLFRTHVDETLDVEARPLGPTAAPAVLAISEEGRQRVQVAEAVRRYEKEGRFSELPAQLQQLARAGILDLVAKTADRTLILNMSNDVVRILLDRLSGLSSATQTQEIEPLIARFLHGQALLASGLHLSSERLAEISQSQTELIGTLLGLLSGPE